MSTGGQMSESFACDAADDTRDRATGRPMASSSRRGASPLAGSRRIRRASGSAIPAVDRRRRSSARCPSCVALVSADVFAATAASWSRDRSCSSARCASAGSGNESTSSNVPRPAFFFASSSPAVGCAEICSTTTGGATLTGAPGCTVSRTTRSTVPPRGMIAVGLACASGARLSTSEESFCRISGAGASVTVCGRHNCHPTTKPPKRPIATQAPAWRSGSAFQSMRGSFMAGSRVGAARARPSGRTSPAAGR